MLSRFASRLVARRASRRSLTLTCFACVGGIIAAPLAASVTEFAQDSAGFALAAGSDAVTLDFDDLAPGADIDGQTIGGATFTAVGSPLMVVDSTSTGGTYENPFNGTNRLIATTGANLVSPGGGTLPPGPDVAVENDDLQITFAQPVGYFGLDHLSQQSDGKAYTGVEVVDAQGQTIFAGEVPIALMPAGEEGIVPGGVDFWGIVSDSDNIAKVIFNEHDENANAPDNNVGYDSLRFGQLAVTPPPAIPLPAAVATFPLAAAAAIAARHFRRG